LLRRISEGWDITVVDVQPEQLKRVAEVRSVTAVEGDGSSAVVLREAGLVTADALIATTSDDEVNLEACRLAVEADVFRVAAAAADPERLEDYRRLGIGAHAPDGLAARLLDLELEPRRVASMAFAHGQAEAIEVEIAGDAPVKGQALMNLPSADWIVGAILRHGELIIPHGHTVLQEGDLVTIIGNATSFGEIIRTFTSGRARFPLEFGRQVAVVVDSEDDLGGIFAEAVYLTRNSLADQLLVLHAFEEEDPVLAALTENAEGVEVAMRRISTRPTEALVSVAREGNVGVLVIPPLRESGWLASLRRPLSVKLVQQTRIPVLVARGSYPYRELLVPARLSPSAKAAARAAIDLARIGHADLTGLGVVDANFIAGPGAADAVREAAGQLKQEAAVQGVSLKRRIRRGNPVRVFREFATDLLVVGADEPTRPAVGVRVLDHLIRTSPSSVLVVPVKQ
jgi:Trk K+ transport system NAD-binding subunit/nucleotide-binding universal stress UspA family protein